MNVIEQETSKLIERAQQLEASDIHLHPSESRTNVWLRMQGELVPWITINQGRASKWIAHLKYKAGMDLGERRRPQHGAIQHPLPGKELHIRLSTLPSDGVERLVIRLLPQHEHHPLQKLALFPEDATRLETLLKRPHGLVLFTGPTGSGKTTTMYTLLHHLVTSKLRQVITIEDPIEQTHPLFTQMQVNEHAGLTYESGLKSALRHDPDVLMLGEIRDVNTAAMAVRAAMTGHLVLSTLHTKSAARAVERLCELGIPKSDVLDVTEAVVSQRLVSMKCPYCKDTCHLYCPSRQRLGRRGIYEISHQQDLFTRHHSDQIRRRLYKAAALGYISHAEGGADG
ncbi:competence-related pilin export protein ComGA [Salsuginibacillus halophilus]|uniref:Competence-related pilin export protein ComGA n=1 Tax=Salsuginibacillus halophilus TaxID=517424 RepID=A0A2P8H7Z6_9BACI|nr:competence type IV pilus ATPase ComGA [Salsuginibacillus halophilus]PSL42338.1 competence-related pilin export protein ComGA [Salsuginibacillus halophilus]